VSGGKRGKRAGAWWKRRAPERGRGDGVGLVWSGSVQPSPGSGTRVGLEVAQGSNGRIGDDPDGAVRVGHGWGLRWRREATDE
jgi:hypothetical protein